MPGTIPTLREQLLAANPSLDLDTAGVVIDRVEQLQHMLQAQTLHGWPATLRFPLAATSTEAVALDLFLAALRATVPAGTAVAMIDSSPAK